MANLSLLTTVFETIRLLLNKSIEKKKIVPLVIVLSKFNQLVLRPAVVLAVKNALLFSLLVVVEFIFMSRWRFAHIS